MARKSVSVIGIIFLLFIVHSCAQHPEEGLLKRYFHAVTLNDTTTMSSMALEPISMDVNQWELLSVSEEKIEEAALPGINKKELELKKAVEDSVKLYLDARDELDNAQFDWERARTRAAKRAAKKKVEEYEAKFEEVKEHQKQVQKDYNEAKAASAREEELSTFSIGTDEISNIRELIGEVRYKEAEVKVISEAETTNYKFYLRKYDLKDESAGFHYRGQWKIIKIESLS